MRNRARPISLLVAAVSAITAAAQTPGPGPALMRAEAERAYARALADGARLFAARTPPLSTNGASCARCHGADGRGLAGVARRHPVFDERRGRAVPLEERIALEIKERLKGQPPAPGSPGSVALMVFVKEAPVRAAPGRHAGHK